MDFVLLLDRAEKAMHNEFRDTQREEGTTMAIRLIALDLDGTLLTENKVILPETLSALTKAGEAGILVVPATGRPLSGVPEEVLSIPFLRYLITSNGAFTYQYPGETILRRHTIPRTRAMQILEYLDHPGLLTEVFIEGRGYHESETNRIMNELYRGTPLENYLAGSRTIVDSLSVFLDSQPMDVENISTLFLDTERLQPSYRELRERDDITVVQSAPRVLEIGSSEADKGKAVSELAGSLGIAREEIMVFGDSNNDFGLFDAAGTAVAMNNATRELKDHAHRITASNEEDGIGIVIREILAH